MVIALWCESASTRKSPTISNDADRLHRSPTISNDADSLHRSPSISNDADSPCRLESLKIKSAELEHVNNMCSVCLSYETCFPYPYDLFILFYLFLFFLFMRIYCVVLLT